MPDHRCPNCHGTGRVPEPPTGDEIRAYMRATGWTEEPPGRRATMWTRDHRAIAVVTELRAGTVEYASVITRLSWAGRCGMDEIITRIVARRDAPDAPPAMLPAPVADAFPEVPDGT